MDSKFTTSQPKDDRHNEFAKVKMSEAIAFGCGSIFQNFVFGLLGSYLLFYFTNVDQIASYAGAAIFLIVNWINVIWDPIVGVIIDKRKPTKHGKYKPLILGWGLPMMACAVSLFIPIPNFKGIFLVAGGTYIATNMIYTMISLPWGSLLASITRDNESMTRLISVNTLVGNIGYWLIQTIFPVIVQLMSPDKVMKKIGLFGLKLPLGNYAQPAAKPAWFKAYLLYMVIGFCGMLFAYFRVHERVLPSPKEEQKIHFSDYWTVLKQSRGLRVFCWFVLCACLWNSLSNGVWPFFMQYNIGHSEWIAAIGTIGSIPGIFLVALWPWFRKHFGKKGFFYFFIIMFIVGELLLWIWSVTPLKNSMWMGYLGSFLKSWGLTSATGYMWRLSPELITFAEYHTGKRPAGIIKALTGLVYKIGTVIASFLPAFINGLFKFNSHAQVQTPHALFGIQITQIWLPIIIAALSYYFMSKYPLTDKQVDDMNKAIVERKGAEKD